MRDLTVIYYTSQRECPEFEARIRSALLESAAGLPLISVSQQPLDLGENIVVGDVGASSQNAWRQFLIGATAAKTEFVCTAESDFLYPAQYFAFRPPRRDTLYLARPLYTVTAMRGKVCIYRPKKLGSFGACVASREKLIQAVSEVLAPLSDWGDVDERQHHFNDIYHTIRRSFFHLEIPVLSFQTDNGMHRGGPHYAGSVRELPHWGTSQLLRRKFLVGT